MKLIDVKKEIDVLIELGQAFSLMNGEGGSCIIHHFSESSIDSDCDSDVMIHYGYDDNYFLAGRFKSWEDKIADDTIFYVDEFDKDNEWTKIHAVASYDVKENKFNIDVNTNLK